MEIITKNIQETQQVARDLVKRLSELAHQGALVLALEGELGAGKTVFTQGLAKALGVKEKVLSPTFVIMKNYDIKILRLRSASRRSAQGIKKLYHCDCYRIEKAKDLAGLGVEEVLKDKKNLVVIEWAERIKNVLPKDAVWIKFEHRGGDVRKLKM